MNIIDISWPISNQMVTYKNKQDVLISQVKDFASSGVRESKLFCGLHTGTHIDAPAHFLADGACLDQFSLSQLVGSCQVFDLTHVIDKITQLDLINLDFSACQIAIFKTKNSACSEQGDFDPDFIYLDGSAASYLATKNLSAIGIDALGIERCQPAHETHKFLLQANILIIEGLRLSHVIPGAYQLVCLPLNIVGVDSAPARAILIS